MKTTAFIILLILISSCSNKETVFSSEKDFQNYLNNPENGFIKSSDNGEVIIETKLEPSLRDDEHPQLTMHVRLGRVDKLPILDYGGATQDIVAQREAYLSFQILSDVYLEDGDKLITPVFHHYERNYGLKPSIDLFFQFDHFIPQEEKVTFVYRDELFQQGMFRIHYTKDLFTSCHVQE